MILCLLITLLYVQTAQHAPHQAPNEREKVHSKETHYGFPGMIQSALASKPSGDVELRSGQAPPMIVVVDPESTLYRLARENDLVVLGKIDSGMSHATVDQSYIYTEWNLVVEETIKNNSQSPVATGQSIVVVRPGGSVVIEGRRVHASAGPSSGQEFSSGAEVLLYLRYLPKAGTYSFSGDGFIFSGEKRIDLNTGLFEEFGAMQKNDVLALARTTATKSVALERAVSAR